MKKILCALLILSLIFCATALAEGTYDQDEKTSTTTLTTTIAGPDAPLEFRAFSRWRRRAVRTLIRDWFRSAGDSPLPAWCSEIFRTAVPFPAAGDVLGSYLQLLRPEGDKSRAGSYFTPPETARLLIGAYRKAGKENGR